MEDIKHKYSNNISCIKRRVTICAGTGCLANGVQKIYDTFQSELEKIGLDVLVEVNFTAEKKEGILLSESGCQGFCQMGPLVTIDPDNILYVKVKEKDVKSIVEKTLGQNIILKNLLYKNPSTKEHCKGKEEIDFYKKQSRFVLKDCGVINPDDIHEYIFEGGYEGARKAILNYDEKEICNEVINSGLKGRGGGGFLTGKKWELTRIENSEKKYVICNGDEGDPGAFMDRSIMEGNPHSVIEGMIIAGKAIGADEGFVYVRSEYPLAVKRIKYAVEVAEKYGLLGDNIFGSDFNFKINVMEGAGAFVCGEETALMASIQGNRGMPNPKPPFPAQRGLWDKPTVINNVETLSTIPLILKFGAGEFIKIGSSFSSGTKTFALTGHVANTGLIEVPFGTTLREIVYDIGGGVTDKRGKISNEGFKMVQIGGPSGGCLTEEHLDLPLDFDSLTKIGAMIGSGGLVVMNKDTCMVQVSRFFMQFTQNESCGKCVLCREGTKQMLALLDDIIEGRGTIDTINLLEELSKSVKVGSLCGLGKTAPNPILSALNYFREEFEAHVVQQRCPSAKCKNLLMPEIIVELCKGCGLCIRKCPVDAITGEKSKPHTLHQEKCIKCGECIEVCRFNAVTGG
ncbi:MAG: 4Fe-4S binding protein [Ignavibacteriae bacterium]|nr:4Fe-4S dicluster domain-containing protein [Ignavibacteriota bacterium]NOG96353.1 4Fe-4S binding protein [Ignavibacteriota bacterium]